MNSMIASPSAENVADNRQGFTTLFLISGTHRRRAQNNMYDHSEHCLRELQATKILLLD